MKGFVWKKIITIIIAFVLIIGISAGTAILFDKINAAPKNEVEDGLSAYELAVENGYEGTIQEWLESLKGKSAYEAAKENGYTGTEAEWAASLKAPAGKDGVGIKSAAFSDDNELLITLTDGTVLNLGVAGKDGVGIDEIYIQDGNLYVKKTTDTAAVNLGSVKGDKGDTGEQGLKGDKGDPGTNGVDGKSAYELYCETHPEYTGTLEEWLNSLSGVAGRGILRTEFSGTNFIVYYTDGTSEIHDLSGVLGDPNEKEILVFSRLSDDTYGVMAGGMAKYEAVITIPATYNDIPVTQILSNGFKDLTTLQEIEMPNSIKVIGNNAFQGCTGLNNVVFPSSLERIEHYAFNNCASLDSEIIIPVTTKHIGKYAFYGTALTSVKLADNSGWTSEPIYYVCNTSKDYAEITTSSKTMTDFTAKNAPASSVTSINVTYPLNPNSVATALTKRVHYPYRGGDYYWHFDAYKADWENPTVIDSLVTYTKDLEYTLLSDGTYAVSVGNSTDKNIIIPSSYEGISVTKIKENGFKGITDLERVVLPEGIKVIGEKAFYGCTMLEINIPESTKTIEPYALENVKAITVAGNNSWTLTEASWSESFGGTTIDGGKKSFSSVSLAASSYSYRVTIAPTCGGDEAYMQPDTATWTR